MSTSNTTDLQSAQQIKINPRNAEINSYDIKHDEESDSFLARKNFDNRGRVNSFREPLTHIKNKTLFEALFGSCFGDFGTQLTIEELAAFYDLKTDANRYFDNKCEDYDDMFRDLWRALTNTTLDQVQNEGWKDFGFQNANPRSDIRGGALLSLKQLIYFVKSNKERTQQMTSDNHIFLFAVSSVNITYFLIKYYHLAEHLIFEKDKKDICSRVALKTFCSQLRFDSNTLNKIHEMLFMDLYDIWAGLRKIIPKLTLLDFNMALNIVKEKYVKATKNSMFGDINTLRTTYLRLETKLPTKKASI